MKTFSACAARILLAGWRVVAHRLSCSRVEGLLHARLFKFVLHEVHSSTCDTVGLWARNVAMEENVNAVFAEIGLLVKAVSVRARKTVEKSDLFFFRDAVKDTQQTVVIIFRKE